MKENEIKRASKFLSLVLRHKPETIGLILDENGWAKTEELLEKVNQHGFSLTPEQLDYIIENNDKQRFAFSNDKILIRASQGHSIKVDLKITTKTPPEILYHGTATQNIPSIKEKGLVKGQRHHVHLSADKETAKNVGARYGIPVVLEVNAFQMHKDGLTFFQSENGVWLTDHVPTTYIVK